MRHPGLERQRRPERHPAGQVRRRRDAVDGDAGAHEVVASRVAVDQQAGRVGGVHDGGAQPGGAEVGEDGVEAVELLGGVRVVGLVGDREVRAARPRARARRALVDESARARTVVGRRTRRGASRCRPSGARPAAGRSDRPRPPPSPARRCRPRCRRPASSGAATTAAADSGRRLRQQQTGASIPASRSSTPSSTSATPSHAAPASTRRPAPRHGAVAVAVGLHDRHARAPARRGPRARATLARMASRSTSAQTARYSSSTRARQEPDEVAARHDADERVAVDDRDVRDVAGRASPLRARRGTSVGATVGYSVAITSATVAPAAFVSSCSNLCSDGRPHEVGAEERDDGRGRGAAPRRR